MNAATVDGHDDSIPSQDNEQENELLDSVKRLTHEDIVAAAERLVSRERQDSCLSSDGEPEFNYVRRPIKLCKVSQPKRGPVASRYFLPVERTLKPVSKPETAIQNRPDDTSLSGSSSIPIHPLLSEKSSSRNPPSPVKTGRHMVKGTRPSTSRQRIIPGYPLPADPYPRYFGLEELCRDYRNHLYGKNLHPFLAHSWSAGRIFSHLPSQDDLPPAERVTTTAIASRLKKVRRALEMASRYKEVMSAEKARSESHARHTNGDIPEQEKASTEYAQEVEGSPVITSSAPDDQRHVGIFNRYKYTCDGT